MKFIFRLLTLFLACAALSACSGHQPSGFYGSPFIVTKQSDGKKKDTQTEEQEEEQEE